MLTFKANKEQIEIDGLMYYCVYGTYEGGAWLSILNFGVSAELSAMAGALRKCTQIISTYGVIMLV